MEELRQMTQEEIRLSEVLDKLALYIALIDNAHYVSDFKSDIMEAADGIYTYADENKLKLQPKVYKFTNSSWYSLEDFDSNEVKKYIGDAYSLFNKHIPYGKYKVKLEVIENTINDLSYLATEFKNKYVEALSQGLLNPVSGESLKNVMYNLVLLKVKLEKNVIPNLETQLKEYEERKEKEKNEDLDTNTSDLLSLEDTYSLDEKKIEDSFKVPTYSLESFLELLYSRNEKYVDKMQALKSLLDNGKVTKELYEKAEEISDTNVKLAEELITTVNNIMKKYGKDEIKITVKRGGEANKNLRLAEAISANKNSI